MADLAIASAVIGALRTLVAERWSRLEEQQAWEVAPLAATFRAAVRDADAAVIDDRRYLALFGFDGERTTAGELWRHIVSELFASRAIDPSLWRPPLDVILEHGPLSRRILRAVGPEPTRPSIERVYRSLCDCLAAGEMLA